ncbi:MULTISPECIES: hypothetical protein [Sphingobium]|jgi:hypothetical protein|uniref:Uncharacterized protein n=1 Tax=Sphingobium yanoikuyae TaxID=13690 RepID=A0A0J9D0C4_SPHYA|nr:MULTISPECIES: hypothetical protein [Sphingobium]ATP19878.1 hypothetical protein BV87_16740 [Sphingobium yanoikuyae]KMW30778.1 hypothetical protein BV87_04055 [Sphingobium yanoikuyae]QCB39236.1 hypothetical protein E5554_16220 [Sphingobium sp. PAMC28499]
MQMNVAYNPSAFRAALQSAQRRAVCSYFDQHVLEDGENGFIVVDEGDYGALPQCLIERIVHTVTGGLIDEM